MIESACKQCGSIYLKHPRARLDLCCRCRPTRPKKARVLSGETDQKAIQNESVLQDYFSHDALECLVCGERHAGLYRHLLMAHGIKPRDYKIRFGIPVTYGLVGAATKSKMQVNAMATTAKMQQAGFSNLEKARSHKGNTRVSWPTYHRFAHAQKMLESAAHPKNQEGIDSMPCRVCGGEVYVQANISVALQCRVLCASCRSH